MYLRRLELAGFKSFAERTTLDLSKGLNAVVGPNGSGKSNIADALRWVLGEQSAKQLRGGKMEDIIFAGTAHRRPLGYAEIVMKIDNSEGKLPLEFNEVTVSRRVYRSGESEYSINGEACRLKDIQMLFMDTGIGRDGYSIIGQGRIDDILSLRSEDRRTVFEEAAGIGKFKSRRTEALSKLERERQNRARVDDIITDLEEQLEPLETQAEEAKRYLQLRDQFKDAHINIFLTETNRIETELNLMQTTMENDIAQLDDTKQQLINARLAGEGLKKRAAKADIEYRRANEALLEVSSAVEKTEGDIKLSENKIEQQEAERKRINDDIKKREEQILAKLTELQVEETKHNTILGELNKLKSELAEHQKLSMHLEDKARESTHQLEQYNKIIMDAHAALAESRAAITDAENLYTYLEEDKEKLDSDILQHEAMVTEKEEAERNANAQLLLHQDELNKTIKNVETYSVAHTNLTEESQKIESLLRKAQEELTLAKGRHRAISDLEAQHEGFYQSVKAVLRKKKTDPAYTGICGALGELIKVEPKYEIAIETALGGAAQYVVTKNENDAKLAINMLKETKAGRATFLPLSTVKSKNFNFSSISNEIGFVGVASSLISFDTQYQNVIAQQLGDVLVIDNIDNALAINKKHGYTYKIVTLTGERLSPGGAITGGGTNRQTAGIIGRSRQREELSQKVTSLQQTVNELIQQEQDLSSKRKTTGEALASARVKEQSLILDTERAKDKLSLALIALQDLNKMVEQYDSKNETIMQKLVESNLAIRTAKDNFKKHEAHVQEAHNNLETYQKQLEQNRQEQTEETDTLTDLRVEISRLTERSGETFRNIERLKKEDSILTEEISVLKENISLSEKSTEKALSIKEETLNLLEKLKVRTAEIRQEIKLAENDKANIDTAIVKTEEDEREFADSSSLIEKEIARLEMRKEQLDSTSHRLHNEIWEEYGLTPQSAMAFRRIDVSEAYLRGTMQKLKAELSTLVNVNVGAIEAYSQMKTKHDFLTTQRNDILQAETTLTGLIQTLTTQMEEQFATQFKLIAQHFEEVFKQMFSGGKASLRLVDNDNVLESGIEITAQPPGKALQNLMLLSGGERALTAIALLFAILKLKPSPFCVLDEIESALDDANVARYAKYLKEYALGTQFIIITHRKGTMEAAEHLYGVTMEEQGVSKLVSVKFEDTP